VLDIGEPLRAVLNRFALVGLVQALAFGKGVELHQPTLDGLIANMVARGRPASSVNEDRRRMALLPAGCKILPTSSWVPIAVMENVYVLPGIPRMVKEMLEHNEDHFQGVPIHRAMVRCPCSSSAFVSCETDGLIAKVHTLSMEGDLASALTAVQTQHPNVAIGSYLNLTDDKTGQRDESYNTRLTIDGRDADEVELVAEKVAHATQGVRFYE
jgi:molybdopterin-biosynthesis enzyme MoeA-like protein